MKFRGRDIDPVALWSEYVEFPSNTKEDGSEFSPLVFCPNPQHDNFRSPAFQVNLRLPLVHCFSRCGIGGTYEHAVAMIHGLYEKHQVSEATNERERTIRRRKAEREARKIILRGAKTSVFTRVHDEKRPVAKTKYARKLEYERFMPEAGLRYLKSRGVSGREISLWELGWDPENQRIVIPGNDENGRLRFLIKRAVKESQQPKYLYTEGFEKTSVLFGADTVLKNPAGIILVEGSLDVIKLSKYGLPAVGILGTGISDRQRSIISNLRPKSIFLMFDKDAAGVRNIEIAYEMLKHYPLHVCRYPKGKSDPAELSEKEAEHSIRGAIPILIWRKRLRERQTRP